MSGQNIPKGIKAQLRRQERESQKRWRELQRQIKEQAREDARELARLEVESFENKLEVLLSMHKEQGEPCDWLMYATALPPHSPIQASRHSLRSKQQAEFLRAMASSNETDGKELENARIADEKELAERAGAYLEAKTRTEEMRNFARRILAGDPKAFTEALQEFSPLTELTELGSSMHFTVHDSMVLECVLNANGHKAIPAEIKSLTSSGKVSERKIPKGRFHEIYQDYLCGCILRIGREAFALLPVATVLVTAFVESLDSSTGNSIEVPVLSVALNRQKLVSLNFENLDPSDAMENFVHRGDAKASRRSGEFIPITPLSLADITAGKIEDMKSEDLLAHLRSLQKEVFAEYQNLTRNRRVPVAIEDNSI